MYTTRISTSTEQWHEYECVSLYSGRQRHRPKLQLPLYTLTKTYTHTNNLNTHLLYLMLYIYIVHAKLTFILWLRSTNDFYITRNTKKQITTTTKKHSESMFVHEVLSWSMKSICSICTLLKICKALSWFVYNQKNMPFSATISMILWWKKGSEIAPHFNGFISHSSAMFNSTIQLVYPMTQTNTKYLAFTSIDGCEQWYMYIYTYSVCGRCIMTHHAARYT